MNAADTLSMSWSNLRRRKGRTALTAAGVVVGTAALVLMISLGLGLRREVMRLFDTDDALRTLSVTRPLPEGGRKHRKAFHPFHLGGAGAPITEKDLEEIRAIPGVASAVPELNMLLRIAVDKTGASPAGEYFPVAGVAPGEEGRFREVLVAGRLWNPGEKDVLLPRSFLEHHLGAKPEEVVGRGVRFGGASDEEEPPPEGSGFVVAGVFDSDRVGLRGRQAFLPMETAIGLRDAFKGGLSLFPYKKGTYGSIEARVSHPRAMSDVRARLQNSGYRAFGAADVIESINLIFLIVEGFLACLGAIGLVVSLFGIANTMAMAVLERTREIGIMKALGARRRDIGRVFLAEAAMIGVLGGAAGMGLGFLSGLLLDAAARGFLDIPDRVSLFHVSPWLAAGSVAFSVFVSILAGTLPARRAAGMDPVEALRYE